MHDIILKAMSALHGLSSGQELSGFLRDLRPVAKSLWQGYQSGYISVSYREPKVQAVYMLRYFPHHAEAVRAVLDELYRKGDLPFQEELLCVSLFGCGPAPELCGIMQFLKSRFPRSEMILAHLLDVAPEGWMYSRQITLDYLVPTLWDKHLFEAHSIPFDLSRLGSVSSLVTINGSSNEIAESSLVTFQNCLNEFPRSSHYVVTENIIALLRAMRPGNVMLIIDRAGYQGVMDLLLSICSLAEKQALAKVLVFDQDKELDCKPILDRMPPVLTASLLVRKAVWSDIAPDEEGLLCSRWVRYHCLALRRT